MHLFQAPHFLPFPPRDESSSSRPCKYFKKMNSSSPTESSPTESGGFALTFGISIGVLSAIAIAIFASYFCTRKSSAAGRSHLDGSLSMDDQDSVVIDIGLDEATLNTYPQLLYSEAKEKLQSGDDGSAGASCCSICLADYKDSDLLRLLPDCDHLFPFTVHRSMAEVAYFLPNMSKLACPNPKQCHRNSFQGTPEGVL
ncbi:ZINC FINGER C3HC4 TYPE (RING FINGER) PROTEIN [Salix koriyanagi]|uniref:ZINC FINGER C3HC4 TYPE (RING FINGER) PROTEIN n=1 Tax=Salix koriyanagi TaxID=2511006 RepID=A0A9Q1AIY2_9ROSI|nr:ZINC FINGER C3HC4 TYPE (RING FINGER) PROTEIN [Salix koriyanagi]